MPVVVELAQVAFPSETGRISVAGGKGSGVQAKVASAATSGWHRWRNVRPVVEDGALFLTHDDTRLAQMGIPCRPDEPVGSRAVGIAAAVRSRILESLAFVVEVAMSTEAAAPNTLVGGVASSEEAAAEWECTGSGTGGSGERHRASGPNNQSGGSAVAAWVVADSLLADMPAPSPAWTDDVQVAQTTRCSRC